MAVAGVLTTAVLAGWELLNRRISANVGPDGEHEALGFTRDESFWEPPTRDLDVFREDGAGDLPPDALIAVIDLVPLGLLAGALAALHTEATRQPDERPPGRVVGVLILLFAMVVCGSYSVLYAYRIPISFAVAVLALGLVVRRRRPVADAEAAALVGVGGTRRGQILGDPDLAAHSWNRIAPPPSASGQTPWLHALRGGGLPGPSPTVARLWATPGRVALGLGQEQSWWNSGMAAIRVGLPLALIPAAHYLFVLCTTNGSTILREAPFGVIVVTGWFLWEYAFWLVSAFTLGALFAYLPGRTGIIKGATLGLVYALSTLADELLPGPNDVVTWVFLSASTTLYLCVVGFLFDLRTLRAYKLGWAAIGPHYGAPHLQTVAAYAIPFLVLTGWVLQQAVSGDAQRAIGDLFDLAPSLVPLQPR